MNFCIDFTKLVLCYKPFCVQIGISLTVNEQLHQLVILIGSIVVAQPYLSSTL